MRLELQTCGRVCLHGASLKSEIRSLTSDVLSCLNLSAEAVKRKGKRGGKGFGSLLHLLV